MYWILATRVQHQKKGYAMPKTSKLSPLLLVLALLVAGAAPLRAQPVQAAPAVSPETGSVLYLPLIMKNYEYQPVYVSGTVRNASDGLPVNNAAVCILNYCDQTDPNGFYNLGGIQAGSYNISIIHPDYYEFETYIDLDYHAPLPSYDYALSPNLLTGEQMRIVVTWALHGDLDTKLIVPCINGEEFCEISPGFTREYPETGTLHARIENDDLDKGPESVFINIQDPGEYTLYIENQETDSPPSITAYRVRIQVYNQYGKVAEFAAPLDSDDMGTKYYAFTYDKDRAEKFMAFPDPIE